MSSSQFFSKQVFEYNFQQKSLLPHSSAFSRSDICGSFHHLINPGSQSSYTWSRRVSHVALLLAIWGRSNDRSKQSARIRRGGADEERGARITSAPTSPWLFSQAGRTHTITSFQWASLPASIGSSIFLASAHSERNLMKQFLRWLLLLTQNAWACQHRDLAPVVGTNLG